MENQELIWYLESETEVKEGEKKQYWHKCHIDEYDLSIWICKDETAILTIDEGTKHIYWNTVYSTKGLDYLKQELIDQLYLYTKQMQCKYLKQANDLKPYRGVFGEPKVTVLGTDEEPNQCEFGESDEIQYYLKHANRIWKGER